MTQKRSSEQSEEKKATDSPQKGDEEKVGEGSRIVDCTQKSVYDAAKVATHANDKSPSQLELPAHGSSFGITGEHVINGSVEKKRSETEKSGRREVEDTESILQKKAKDGDPFALKFIKMREEIEHSAATGHERQAQLAQVQKEIETMFARSDNHRHGGNSPEAEPKRNIYNTAEISSLAKVNELAAAGEQMLASTSDPKVREVIKSDISEVLQQQQEGSEGGATQVGGPIVERPNQVVQKHDGSLQLNINAVENVPQTETNHDLDSRQQPVTDWQTALRRISELPADKQLEIIAKGLQTFNQSVEQSNKEQAIGTTIGVVQGVGNTLIGIVNLAQFAGDSLTFAADIATNNPRYLKTADKVGEAIGKTLVTGVQLFRLADAYVKNVEQTKDYSKPFHDISHLGNELNRKWLELPTRERARVAAQFTTELGVNFIPLVGASKLARSEKLVDTLQDIGTGVKELKSLEAEENYIRSVTKLVDNLEETAEVPKALVDDIDAAAKPSGSRKTPGGEVEHHGSIRDADDVRRNEVGADAAAQPFSAERFQELLKLLPPEASPKFVAELQKQIDSLSDFERAIFNQINLKKLPALAADPPPRQDLMRTLGSFRLQGRELRMAEFVWQGGQWKEAENIGFTFRHELGHAFNVLFNTTENPISEMKSFKRLCNYEFDKLSDDTKSKLFSRFARVQGGKITYNKVEVWDEVFADAFAHTRPGVNAIEGINDYNLLMKQAFPKTVMLVDKYVNKITKK
jgi:hypothetical protein